MSNRVKVMNELENEIIALLTEKQIISGEAAAVMTSILTGIICQVPTKMGAINLYARLTENILQAISGYYDESRIEK